ncbi:hypothetical protein HGM15179_007739 [Zosterops borbonicus]|uniref:Myotubularin phosphatase domain-containing protein n=1 Tax=Zosterops borbonicus TaxID=364589 RepID=A0A8K1LMU5_9PASS|nr:hypothetical protein HGM15179_007739 [Zosterops borbonicus]
MANRAAGKGYENEDNYENIRFKFIGIENIHVMRSSLQKLLEVQIVKAMLYLKIMSAVLDIEPDRRVLTIPMKSGFNEV